MIYKIDTDRVSAFTDLVGIREQFPGTRDGERHKEMLTEYPGEEEGK